MDHGTGIHCQTVSNVDKQRLICRSHELEATPLTCGNSDIVIHSRPGFRLRILSATLSAFHNSKMQNEVLFTVIPFATNVQRTANVRYSYFHCLGLPYPVANCPASLHDFTIPPEKNLQVHIPHRTFKAQFIRSNFETFPGIGRSLPRTARSAASNRFV
jgi:hypothetical protein